MPSFTTGMRFWQGDWWSNAGGLLKAASVVLFGVTKRWQRSERCQRYVKKRYWAIPLIVSLKELQFWQGNCSNA